MDRREALKKVAFLMGGAISATTMGVIFQSFTLPEAQRNFVTFSGSDEAILAEFADIILPTTKSSPGAKAAGIGTFIPMMVNDCYPESMQQIFATGLKAMNAKCLTDFNKNFLSLTIEERQKIMGDLRDEAIATEKAPSFFLIARDLTILGYFSSEIGCTQAREYLLIPGSYDGNAEYKPGQKAWAT
jgi:hypothetical protein